MSVAFQSQNQIRADFSAAMSRMYQSEVPAYGQLLKIVSEINKATLTSAAKEALDLQDAEDTGRITQERHGAIRLGTADELAMMCRVFAIMGMEPVGYYDLSIASVPVHSTAFRPIHRQDLAQNPFRVFTSLLRLELIEDAALREKAIKALQARKIFTARAIKLTQKAENQGGLSAEDSQEFVAEVLETFRWHSEAIVQSDIFDALINAHRLIADVVSFKGPHINHLTPRTLDIDAAQKAMIETGLPAKAVVEGPPNRSCPILLRQTAFKALNEAVAFPDGDGGWVKGQHTARFGEIEQRGAALTPKGRALYDTLLSKARAEIVPAADGSNTEAYMANLESVFTAFPDDWRIMHDQGLAYFKYQVADRYAAHASHNVSQLLDEGALMLSPIIYEDFLPVSAAGIFQSNLGDEARQAPQKASNQSAFEKALGRAVKDEFALYEAIQTQSLEHCLTAIAERH